METEKFEQAKKVKESLDKLERQQYKLEAALKFCKLSVTIDFTHSGPFSRTDSVNVYNKEAVKEMIIKELERLKEEIELVKKEFNEL